MKKILFITLILLLKNFAYSQTCLPNGITFSTQQEIDNFVTDYPGCSEIEGNVTIKESTPGAITNLLGLSVITRINGFLRITDNSDLTNLDGLENLISIASFMALGNNSELTNIIGLQNLTTVGWGSLTIYNNPSLTSLNGLNKIEEIANDLKINQNRNLTNLIGLENVSTIGRDLEFKENESLHNLNGLSSLTSIGRNLRINDNNSLHNLDGLNNLTTIGGGASFDSNLSLNSFYGLNNLEALGDYLFIVNNDKLINLYELKNISSIDGHLYISDNESLVSLFGIHNIDPNTIESKYESREDLEIHNNPLLSSCHIHSICDFLNLQNKTKNINNNKGGCNTIDEIIASCNLPPLSCTFLIEPENNTTSVDQNIIFSWTPVEEAFGYKLKVGTSPGGTEVIDITIFGNVTTFNPGGLPCDETLYVTIIPYNDVEEASGCPEESFTTKGVIANAGSDAYIHIDQSAQLQATGGIYYSWSPIEGLDNPNIPNPIASPDETTVYIVTVSDDDGCSDTDDVKVEVNPSPSKMIVTLHLDDNCNRITSAPECTSLIEPLNNNEDVNITTEIKWSASSTAEGYIINAGTTSGGTDILDDMDVGNVTNYDPGGLPCDETIFISIVPYNVIGESQDCSEESFSTQYVDADAGDDVEISLGENTQLLATGGTIYSWSPTEGLDNPNISNPIASPGETTIYTVTVSDDEGCSDTAEVTVSVNTTVTENIEDKNNYINIYPNPNTGKFNLVLSSSEVIKNATINVYSLNSKIVYSEKTFSDSNKLFKQLDLSDLPAGSYFLKVNNEKQVFISKLFLNH